MKMVKICAVAAATTAVIASSASAFDAPTGDVLLTISGDLVVTNVDNTAQFDLDTLQDFEATSFATGTPWTEGTHTYTGVALIDLLEFLQIESGTLTATAINDYGVDVPVADAVEGGPIVAYLLDGETMSVRDKGPLWLVYPYDLNDDYKSELIYSRSIWQLDRISVTE